MKYDGYRIGCRVRDRTVTLVSRNGKDWTQAFPEIVDAVRALGVRDALIDGEVAMVLADGRTSFQALQNAFSGGPRRGLAYFVFDVLRLGGESLEHRPLEDRKREVRRLLGRSGGRNIVRYSEHVIGRGQETFAEACRLQLEGIISKRRDAPYKTGRTDTWLKTKCVLRQEFVIGGFTEPEGSRQGIGALLAGVYEDGELRFTGKVGTGFSVKVAGDLRKRLDALEQERCPFTPRPAGWLGKHAHWVRPALVAEVMFTEWTGDGKIRHPSFQGLRGDKRPATVVRERAADPPPPVPMKLGRAAASARRPRAGASKSAGSRPSVAGVPISHPDRVIYPELGISKLDVARYYERIADWMLPHVQGRALTLVRCPEGIGECFYMKHSKVWAPSGLRRVRIQEKTKVGEYLVADTAAALVGLAQMGVLEIHTWNSHVERVEQPDRLVLDVDPGEKATWDQVVDAARLIRQLLQRLDLDCFLKTTGGRGLHIVVPLTPSADWQTCLAFARSLAVEMERRDPARYTTAFAKAGRERKLLIDYLRNNRTNTSVAAFSTRARPGATISTPLRWTELKTSLDPAAFTIETIEKRLSRLREDPWKDYWQCRQRLPKQALGGN
jgi:bifunctional non-homologous end joining protein LigD